MTKEIITKKEKKILLENFFSLSTLQGFNYILPLVILPYLIRVIGPEKFGLIAFAQAFVQYFMILTDYGFSVTATREISLCQGHKAKTCAVFSSVMTVKFIIAGICCVIMALLVQFVPRFRADHLVYIFSFGAVIGNTLFPVWFFQGTEKMKYITIINAIFGTIYTISIFIFVRNQAHYLMLPLLTSLFSIATGVYGLFIAFRRFELSFVIQPYHTIRQQLKTGWNIFISIVAINAYTTTRIFAIGLLTNNTITGFYSIAERIANFFQTFPLTSLSQALYPRINRIFAKNRQRAIRLMNKIQITTTLYYLIAIPLIYIACPLIVRLVCSAPYPEVAISLRLLLISVFFVCANSFRVQFLLVCGRSDLYSKLHITAALAGLPLIFILIHYLSYQGAAVSTIIIEGMVLLLTAEIITELT
ncbi:MAG: flippase [Candidatus Omnitrophica bacterium]|nr:flippase [Candidatus Omnitrophota bacterium]